MNDWRQNDELERVCEILGIDAVAYLFWNTLDLSFLDVLLVGSGFN